MRSRYDLIFSEKFLKKEPTFSKGFLFDWLMARNIHLMEEVSARREVLEGL
jgi:hypothetical protein